MCFKHIAFAFTCCVILQSGFNQLQDDIKSKEEITIKEEADYPPDDKLDNESFTFVALIDIVFTDGSKRSCTGAIIHDNVVITAAHCFVHETNCLIPPELSACFVIIGSKNMFATGYEQYLPIERVVTHPHFKRWTADLSLVFTFAGMTSDKPGKSIPLAGERVHNAVDSNVTIFSWGHGKEEEEPPKESVTKEPRETATTDCPDSSSGEAFHSYGATVGMNRAREQPKRSQKQGGIREIQNIPEIKTVKQVQPALRQQTRFDPNAKNRAPQNAFYPYLIQQHKMSRIDVKPEANRLRPTNKKVSLYLPSDEYDDYGDQKRDRTNSSAVHRKGPEHIFQGASGKKNISEPLNSVKTYYKNWRRSMGTQQNKLTVEMFGFVNLAACKKIVEAAMSPLYEIKNGEVACYSSEEHYLTDEDSGAPAVRHGQLVAVTVGGAQCDGDQVGVGIMMSCYCSWIADNLPGGGSDMNCCKNCCDIQKKPESRGKSESKRSNKFFYI